MCLAAIITTNRRASAQHPKALLSASGVLGCILSTIICLPACLGLPLNEHMHEEDGAQAGTEHSKPGIAHALTDLEPLFWPIILVDAAIIVGWIVSATMIAPRFISGTQVALILLLGALLWPQCPLSALYTY